MFHKCGKSAKKDQNGLASIVVVGILIVLLTLISLGFARIMDRTVRNALNDETATAAQYAAQSGINDLATYIRSNPNAKAENCKDLIVSPTGNRGPFYASSDLSGDRNSEYTCILLNQRPTSLVYQRLPAQKSKIIKMTNDAGGSLDSLLISWQSTNGNNNNKPGGNVTSSSDILPDEATWNSSSYIPMLRLTLYPVPTSGSLTDVQSRSKTVFLYPHQKGAVGTVTQLNYASITDGSIYHVGCGTDDDAPGFVGLATMECDLAISQIAGNVPNLDYFFARIMPVYDHAALEIKARDIDGRDIKFKGVQAILDVTAKVGPASKRLQARVDIGGNPSVPTDPLVPSPNVSPDSDSIPEYTVRSAAALCKRALVKDSLYDYVVIESSSPACNWNTILDIPSPQINYYQINDIDHNTETPAGSGHDGTSYISSGGLARLEWQSQDADSCTASGHPEWNGEKAGSMTWNPATRTGTGTQNINGITLLTNFNLQCSGPGGPTPELTVTAWPPPRVTISKPGSVEAGTTYTISWTSNNSNHCRITSTGNHPWEEEWNLGAGEWASATRNRGFNTSPYDQTSKSYTVTCRDPSGRTVTDTTGPIVMTKPTNSCPVSWDIIDNDDGTGTLTWSGTCPVQNPGDGYYRFTDCNTTMSNYLRDSGATYDASGGCYWVGNGRNEIVGPGEYCGTYQGGFDPWGWVNGDGRKCITITIPPVEITRFSVGELVWSGWAWGCWYVPDAANHNWFICNIGVTAQQSGTPSSQIHCQLLSDGSGVGTFGHNVDYWQLGWYGPDPPYSSSHEITWRCYSDRGGPEAVRCIKRSYPPSSDLSC